VFIYLVAVNTRSSAPEVVDDGALYKFTFYFTYLQCFDTVGWATGRASGL